MRTLLPELAERRRTQLNRPALFYEVKSNLKRRDVCLLAEAGIVRVQPGIENFNSRVLKHMRKGVSGLDQIAALKWCTAYGIDLIYGYLAGIPEEKPEDVRDAVRVIAFIHHLQPPVGVNIMGLHRFSPYADSPEMFGLKDIRPFDLQRIIFRRSDDILSRLCYEMDYRPPWGDDPEHLAAHVALRAAITAWSKAFEGGSRLVARDDGIGGIIVLRKAPRATPVVHRLSGASARLLRAMDDRTTIAAAARHAEVSEAQARTIVPELVAMGLAYQMEDEVLGLAIPDVSLTAAGSVTQGQGSVAPGEIGASQ
jgi:hypothetical protein